MDAGATVVKPGVLHGDFAGDCMRPQGAAVHFRKRGPGPTKSVFADLEVRCRRCEACRKQAQRQWMARAIVEVKLAQRTWFGTLTLNPQTRMRYLNELRMESANLGSDYDENPIDARWRDTVRLFGRDLTLWGKRVRAESRSALRCLFVFERHRDGTPHVHGLVHEGHGTVQVGRRTLDGQWAQNGFSQWRLLKGDPVKAAAYVTKYVTKTMDARVRASIGYGNPEVVIAQAVRSGLHTVSNASIQNELSNALIPTPKAELVGPEVTDEHSP